jgi:hypothetical protein
MESILNLIDEGNFISLLLLIGVVAFVGQKMVESQPTLHQWGWRLAAGAFIAYAVYAGVGQQPADPEDWISVVLRGLLAGGLALGLSWIILSAAFFVLHHPVSLIRSFKAAAARRQKQHECPASDQSQWQNPRLEAERRAQQQQHSIAQAEAKRRRTDARARAALTYSLYVSKLQHRFTQQMFDDFVAKYMGDDQLPEDVERRFEELFQTLQKHLAEAEPPEENRTLADLAQWFVDQKARIESLPVDERVKRLHLAELTTRYAELSSRLMEKLRP